MIRIRRIPFQVFPSVELCTERPLILTNYQIPTIEDVYYQSGNHIRLTGDWEKYQISLRSGNRILDHFLLTNVVEKKLGEFPLYPILTVIHNLQTERKRSVPILHKRGIERIYEIVNKTNQPLTFLAEIFFEKLRTELAQQLYGPSTLDDSILDLLDEGLAMSEIAHNENHEARLGSIQTLIQELNDLYYSGLRHSESLSKAMMEDVLEPLFPEIPKEMFIHPVSRSFLYKREITSDDVMKMLRRYRIEIDHTAELDQLMEQRIQASDFDMDDVGFYEECMELYKLIVSSGYTNIYIEYAFQTDPTHPNFGEWMPTQRSLELVNEYSDEERDPDKERQLVEDVGKIWLTGAYLTDMLLDLNSMEENEFGQDEDLDIKKIEIIVRDNAACVTVYSHLLSCTAYIDFTVMAVLSNSFITNS